VSTRSGKCASSRLVTAKAINEHTHGFLQGFVDLGIVAVPDLVSFENAEYVSRLLAIQAAIPGYEPDAHDRDIVQRFHQQLCISGLLGKGCAITVLHQRMEKLRQTILSAENEIEQIRRSLNLLEVAA